MKEIRAKIVKARRVAYSGIGKSLKTYDDNEVCLRARIVEGPMVMLDRMVSIDLAVSEFATTLPVEFASRLRDELNERLPVEAKQEEVE